MNPNVDNPTTTTATAPSAASTPVLSDLRSTVPPFSAQRLHFQVNRDGAYRWGLLVLLVFLIVVGTGVQIAGVPGGAVLIIVLLGGWFWMTINTARAGQMLLHATVALGHDLTEAEAVLAQALRRWPMQRSVRLLLYHRLASLRHQQRRFSEAIAISHVLLDDNLVAKDRTLNGNGGNGGTGAMDLLQPGDHRPVIGPVRAHLLLLLAESSLEVGDLPGAYDALMQLHTGRLGLQETLQRLSIQTRYELAISAPQYAVQNLRQKVQWAELMPVQHGGAMHVMLAQAAQQAGKLDAAKWLWARAKLLCTAQQLQSPPPLLPPPQPMM